MEDILVAEKLDVMEQAVAQQVSKLQERKKPLSPKRLQEWTEHMNLAPLATQESQGHQAEQKVIEMKEH